MTKGRAAALVVLFALSACGSSAPLTGIKASKDAARVVRNYVDAMRREDFTGAMSFRCAAARATVDEGQYKARFERLTSTLGTIRHVAVSTDVNDHLIPIEKLPGQIEVSYRLTTSLGEHDALISMTGVENGKRVLCGWVTSEGSHLVPPNATLIANGPPTSALPKDLLAVAGPGGGRPYDDRALPGDPSDPGQLDGWTRSWRIADYGGARIVALRYVGPTSSLSAAGDQLKHLEGIGVEVFKVPGVPDAVGVRTPMFTEFWLQDGRTPPFVDSVYAVFGNVLVNVGISNVSTSSHEIAIRLMKEIAARAKP